MNHSLLCTVAVLLGLGCVGTGAAEISDRLSALARGEEPSALDAAMDLANAQLDLAERAFAMARRARWAQPAAGSIARPRMSPAQLERIAFCERNVVAARQVLAKVRQQTGAAAARGDLTASSATPADRP
jgi:hypothetical protein